MLTAASLFLLLLSPSNFTAVDLDAELLRSCFTGDFGRAGTAIAQYGSVNMADGRPATRPMPSTVHALVHAFRVRGASDRLADMVLALDDFGAGSYILHPPVLSDVIGAFSACGDATAATELFKFSGRQSSLPADVDGLASAALRAVAAAGEAGSVSQAALAAMHDDIVDVVMAAADQEDAARKAHAWTLKDTDLYFCRTQEFDNGHLAVVASVPVLASRRSHVSAADAAMTALQHVDPGGGFFWLVCSHSNGLHLKLPSALFV